jgi:integrase/recombinase XerD
MQDITLTNQIHRNQEVVLFHFEKNELFIKYLKEAFPAVKWSQTNRCWYTLNVPGVLFKTLQVFKGKAWVVYANFKEIKPLRKEREINTDLKPLNEKQIKATAILVSYMKSKRYSENTIKTYIDALKTFLRFFENKDFTEIENEDLVYFNNEYILKKNYSESFQNQVVNAVKLFYRIVEHKKLNPEIIHRPKRAKTLPNVLSKEEVKGILNSLTNKKHIAMLSLIYSCGLRSGELLNLKPEHVDSKRNILILKNSKGKKDRIAPLSNKTIDMLREYFKEYRPKTYLFEGQIENTMYDVRSLQLVMKKAIKQAKINKPATLHWLRHSYATQLLESGINLRYIQEILGHKNSKTTEIYTHVSTRNLQLIKSPFDDL